MGGTSWLGALLGPEGTGRLELDASVGLFFSGGRLRGPVSLLGAGLGWSVGFLRTVQWTRASLIFCGQVFKSIRWMPWH